MFNLWHTTALSSGNTEGLSQNHRSKTISEQEMFAACIIYNNGLGDEWQSRTVSCSTEGTVLIFLHFSREHFETDCVPVTKWIRYDTFVFHILLFYQHFGSSFPGFSPLASLCVWDNIRHRNWGEERPVPWLRVPSLGLLSSLSPWCRYIAVMALTGFCTTVCLLVFSQIILYSPAVPATSTLPPIFCCFRCWCSR